MYPHLNIHNSSTPSHLSEDRTRNRSKNCKYKRALREVYLLDIILNCRVEVHVMIPSKYHRTLISLTRPRSPPLTFGCGKFESKLCLFQFDNIYKYRANSA